MKRSTLIFLSLLLIIFCLGGCVLEETPLSKIALDELQVHFIDVGQADATLVRFPDGKHLLIDCGGKKTSVPLVLYLKKQGLKRIDYLVGTHPHEDHIGGALDVIESFEIGGIYMPKVSHNTSTYKNLLETIKKKGLTVKAAKSGLLLCEGVDYRADFIAPMEDTYKSINDYSAVIRLTHGAVNMLFTGDIEEGSENQILATHDIKAQVLKVAHHGSSTSTTPRFLRGVAPTIAVISVGKDNDYGHPHSKVLNRFEGITVYRTDIHGTIVVSSDGKTVKAIPERQRER